MDKKNTPLTVSDKQLNKLMQRLCPALRNAGILRSQLQAVLESPGREMEDQITNVISRLCKRASGIFVPFPAEDTGLIPQGWSVAVLGSLKQDNLESEIDLAKLSFDYCPVNSNEDWINGDNLLERAFREKAYGSLGFAKVLLDAQDQGKQIFPIESRGKHYFLMPRTILLDPYGSRAVAYFDWNGERWAIDFLWLGFHFNLNYRMICPCK